MPGQKKAYIRSDPKLFENLPAALKALPQWVVWQAVERAERPKPEKAPLDPKSGGHARARTDSPNTWGTFDEAAKVFETNRDLHGIGFVFTPQDPFAFIDLDDARDPATGAVGDWAQEIVDRLKSYAEVSPSGTGLRIVVEADAPGPAKRRGKVEIYAAGQYATLTGAIVGKSPKPVAKRQGELADIYSLVFGKVDPAETLPPPPPTNDPKLTRVRALSDDDLITKATGAANGAKFVRLWTAEDVGDRSAADAALCSILAYWTRADAARVDRLFRRSKLMRAKWDERRGANTYGERTVAFAVRGATSLYDPDLELQLAEGHNDVANAEIFNQLHYGEFAWNAEAKGWHAWGQHYWEPWADLRVLLAAEGVSQELLRRATAAPDADARRQERRIKWAISSGDRRRIEAIESFARRRNEVRAADFDRDPYILCCENGVLDLRTGELRDGTRADRCTRSTKLKYDPTAKCPTWDKFLREIMGDEAEMISYLWRVIGYSLTGDVTERAFFLFHGEGRNGKSTLVETLKALLGPPGTGYAQKARFSTFLRKTFSSGGPNDDVAHLAGARVVIASEADERQALDVALVKELTGGDTHRARHLHSREFEFAPQFKLFLVTNKVPPIHETTYAIWDRLHYVPFEWRVPENQVDRGLPLRLLGELPGILAKAAKACLEWQAEGLRPPPKVLKAGAKLYAEMDTFGEFLTDCCETGDNFRVPHKDLYQAFFHWAKDQGYSRPPSSKILTAYLRERKFPEQNGAGNMKIWLGLRPTTKIMMEGGEL